MRIEQNYVNMRMPQFEYEQYCKCQLAKEVQCMCKVINNIMGKSAEELLQMSKQSDVIPVSLTKILNTVGISCLPFDFKGDTNILGALVCVGNNAAIFYRKDDPRDGHRYRFTVAHELAHCCLQHINTQHGSVHYRKETDNENEDEIAANIFAGELLIPEKSLRNALEELLLPSLKLLAQMFAVSENVMRARLDYLEVKRKVIGYNFTL